MPTILVRRVNLDVIYPDFLSPFLDVLDACQKRGAYYFAVSGYRSFSEQAKIYFQGRTTPGAIVTNARPGFSCHNYGIAIDVVRDADLTKVGLQPDWSATGYEILKEEGERLGLQVGVPGVPGGDPGHVQLPLKKALGRKESEVLQELKAIHDAAPKDDALKAVWAHLDGLGFGRP
jgi:peptidoglycan LD-endopeptidase CwlK